MSIIFNIFRGVAQFGRKVRKRRLWRMKRPNLSVESKEYQKRALRERETTMLFDCKRSARYN